MPSLSNVSLFSWWGLPPIQKLPSASCVFFTSVFVLPHSFLDTTSALRPLTVLCLSTQNLVSVLKFNLDDREDKNGMPLLCWCKVFPLGLVRTSGLRTRPHLLLLTLHPPSKPNIVCDSQGALTFCFILTCLWGECTYSRARVWRSEGSSRQSVLSFCLVGLESSSGRKCS